MDSCKFLPICFLIIAFFAYTECRVARLKVCGSNQKVPCDNGECIHRYNWCDGIRVDCADRSDEKYCKRSWWKHGGGNSCTEKHFVCDSGICIPASAQCDRYNNCGDFSDERACDEEGTTDYYDSGTYKETIGAEENNDYLTTLEDISSKYAWFGKGTGYPVTEMKRKTNEYEFASPTARARTRKWPIQTSPAADSDSLAAATDKNMTPVSRITDLEMKHNLTVQHKNEEHELTVQHKVEIHELSMQHKREEHELAMQRKKEEHELAMQHKKEEHELSMQYIRQERDFAMQYKRKEREFPTRDVNNQERGHYTTERIYYVG